MPQSAQLDSESRRSLESAGFEWLPDSMLYVSRALRKAIRLEVIQDHTPAWLKQWIDSPLPANACSLKVNTDAAGVRTQL